jgi:hypothetical protein
MRLLPILSKPFICGKFKINYLDYGVMAGLGFMGFIDDGF